MLSLVAGVHFCIVWRLVGDHAEDDFQESLAEAPESTGVAHALLAFVPIIGLPPGAGFAKRVHPEMDGGAHKFVAGPAHMDLVDFAGLIAHRSRTGDALEHFMAAIARWIGPNGGEQARR